MAWGRGMRLAEAFQPEVSLRYSSVCHALEQLRDGEIAEGVVYHLIRTLKAHDEQMNYNFEELLSVLYLSEACVPRTRIFFLDMTIARLKAGKLPSYQETLEFIHFADLLSKKVQDDPPKKKKLDEYKELLLNTLNQMRGNQRLKMAPASTLSEPKKMAKFKGLPENLEAAEARKQNQFEERRRDREEREKELERIKSQMRRKSGGGKRAVFQTPVRKKPKTDAKSKASAEWAIVQKMKSGIKTPSRTQGSGCNSARQEGATPRAEETERSLGTPVAKETKSESKGKDASCSPTPRHEWSETSSEEEVKPKISVSKSERAKADAGKNAIEAKFAQMNWSRQTAKPAGSSGAGSNSSKGGSAPSSPQRAGRRASGVDSQVATGASGPSSPTRSNKQKNGNSEASSLSENETRSVNSSGKGSASEDVDGKSSGAKSPTRTNVSTEEIVAENSSRSSSRASSRTGHRDKGDGESRRSRASSRSSSRTGSGAAKRELESQGSSESDIMSSPDRKGSKASTTDTKDSSELKSPSRTSSRASSRAQQREEATGSARKDASKPSSRCSSRASSRASQREEAKGPADSPSRSGSKVSKERSKEKESSDSSESQPSSRSGAKPGSNKQTGAKSGSDSDSSTSSHSDKKPGNAIGKPTEEIQASNGSRVQEADSPSEKQKQAQTSEKSGTSDVISEQASATGSMEQAQALKVNDRATEQERSSTSNDSVPTGSQPMTPASDVKSDATNEHSDVSKTSQNGEDTKSGSVASVKAQQSNPSLRSGGLEDMDSATKSIDSAQAASEHQQMSASTGVDEASQAAVETRDDGTNPDTPPIDAASDQRPKAVGSNHSEEPEEVFLGSSDATPHATSEESQQLTASLEQSSNSSVSNVHLSSSSEAEDERQAPPNEGHSDEVELSQGSAEELTEDEIENNDTKQRPKQLAKAIGKRLTHEFSAELLTAAQKRRQRELENDLAELEEFEKGRGAVLDEDSAIFHEFLEDEGSSYFSESRRLAEPRNKKILDLVRLFNAWSGSYEASKEVWRIMKEDEDFELDALLARLPITFADFLVEAISQFSKEDNIDVSHSLPPNDSLFY